MPQKEYEIAFKLAASKAGSFSAAFATAGKSVSSLGDQIAKMDAQASQLNGLIDARERLNKAVKASKSALMSFQSLRDRSADLEKQTEGLSKEYEDAQQKLKKLERQINRTDSTSDDLAHAYEEQEKKLAELGRVLKRSQAEQRQMASLTKKAQIQYEGTKRSLDSQKKSLQSLDRSMGTTGVSTAALSARQKQLSQASAQASAQLKKQEAIQAKIDKYSGARGIVDKGRGLLNTGGKVAVGALASAAGSVGGAAMGAGTALLKIGSEYQASMNKLQAATGLSAEEMQKLQTTARNLYKAGLGESFGDVANALSTMRQTTGLTGKALEDATKNAMLLSRTFDMDVNESARASSALMKNFGIDGKRAYDLIAYAAQRGANKNGDLLDTFNEYSVQFKALGFSAEQFTAILVKGANNGAFSIDKVADAVKEFNIRAKDGSKTSMEAFEMLGLNGTAATQMFAKGGRDAQLALAEVVKRLNAMDDPVKRNAISVNLFGSQFEDLQGKALESLTAIDGSSVKAAGTMDTIAKLTTQSLGNQITIVARQIQDTLTPAADEAASSIAARMPDISKSISTVSPCVQRLGKAFADALPTILDWMARFVQTAAEAGIYVADNFDKIAAYVGYAVKAFFGLKATLVIASSMMRLYEVGMTVRKMLVGMRASTIAAAVGTRILGAASAAAGIVMKGFSTVVGAVSTALKFLSANPVMLVIAGLASLAIAGSYLIKNWDTVKAKAVELYQNFKANLVDAMAPVIAQFQAIGQSVQAVFTNIVGFVKNVFTGQWSAAWENVKGIFSNVFNALSGIVKAPMNALIALVNSVIKSINNIGSVKLPKIMGGGTIGLNIPEIPLLAEGGVIKSPTLACVAEAGEPEAVIPLSKLSQMLQPMAAAPSENAPLVRAGRALSSGDAYSASGAASAPISINFAPTINVSGADATPDGIANKVIDLLRSQLEGQVQQMLDRQSRVSFA